MRTEFPHQDPGPRPPPQCTIVIGGIPDDCARATDHGSVAHSPGGSPGQINEKSHSFSVARLNNHSAQSETPRPSYIEKTFPSSNSETLSDTPFIPDYSRPPTPAELQEIKAAINRLRPDLAHLPIPEPHLCSCGHWIFGPCPLGERCRDGSKLN